MRSRREVLAYGLTGLLGAGILPAHGYEIQDQAEWRNSFDTSGGLVRERRSNYPILSTATLAATEQAIGQYGAIVNQGGWPMIPAEQTLKVGSRGPAVTALRQRLTITGDLDQYAGRGDTFDSYVDAAVKNYQTRNGMRPDGIAGSATLASMNVPAITRLRQLELNLRRLADYTNGLPNRFVTVNIPGAEIEGVENGYVVTRHTGAVGKDDRPSPELTSEIVEVNFNPYWHVPKSIVAKDLIPAQQKDVNYLRDHNIRIYTDAYGGTEIQAEQVNWFSDEGNNYLYRQDPSAENSLGQMRLNFPNAHGVFMHDTPYKNLFGTADRFVSSGCVRIQNVREFVTWILGESPEWGRANIDSAIASGERIDARVSNPVHLRWVYLTAWATPDGRIHFRPDIYGRDGGNYAAAN